MLVLRMLVLLLLMLLLMPVRFASEPRTSPFVFYGGASRTPVAEGGGALWKARRSISPREKSGEKSSVGSAPRGVSALESRAAGRNSGRTRAISPGTCRGSLWFARIPTLAA